MYKVVAGHALLEAAKDSPIPYFQNKKALEKAQKYADMLKCKGLIPELYYRIMRKAI
jgi:hypothetical protein